MSPRRDASLLDLFESVYGALARALESHERLIRVPSVLDGAESLAHTHEIERLSDQLHRLRVLMSELPSRMVH